MREAVQRGERWEKVIEPAPNVDEIVDLVAKGDREALMRGLSHPFTVVATREVVACYSTPTPLTELAGHGKVARQADGKH